MRVLNKKVITGVVAGTIVLGGSGVALAYWTTAGSGSGEASTSSTDAKLITQQKGTVSNLFPGGAPQNVVGTVTNDGPSSVFVRQVEVKISGVPNRIGTGCDASDYTIANPIVPVNAELAKKGDLVEIHGATIKFNNKADEDQNDCKGAIVSLQFVVS
jgi:hypothetical protein